MGPESRCSKAGNLRKVDCDAHVLASSLRRPGKRESTRRRSTHSSVVIGQLMMPQVTCRPPARRGAPGRSRSQAASPRHRRRDPGFYTPRPRVGQPPYSNQRGPFNIRARVGRQPEPAMGRGGAPAWPHRRCSSAPPVAAAAVSSRTAQVAAGHPSRGREAAIARSSSGFNLYNLRS